MQLLDERRKKIILAEMKALTASAENNIVSPFLLRFLTVSCGILLYVKLDTNYRLKFKCLLLGLLGTTCRQKKIRI